MTAPVTTRAGAKGVSTGRVTLGAILLLLMLMSALVTARRNATGCLGFVDDSSYLNLVVATHVRDAGYYGVSGHPIPATRDVLWRLLLSACSWLTNDFASAPYLLGALAAVLALCITMSLAKRISADISFAAVAGVLLVFATSLSADAISGESTSLAGLLVMLALYRHVRGLEPSGAPLPLSAAFAIGLAALLHIEFAALWLAFALHALILCFTRPRGEKGFAYTVIRALNGVILIAIVIGPLAWWNVRTIGVPWPRFAHAPLTLDAWQTGAPDELLSQMRALMGVAVIHGYGWLQGAPFMQGFVARIFAWAGAILLVVDAVRNRALRSATGLLVVLLAPIAFAPFYPYAGRDAVPAMAVALQPAWVLLAGYAMMRAARTLAGLLDRYASAVPMRSVLSWIAIGGLVALHGFARTVQAARSDRTQLVETAAARDRAMAALSETGGEAETVTASDRVGWLLFRGIDPVVDLSGEVTPQILAFREGETGWNIEGVRDYLRDAHVSRAAIWQPEYEPLAEALGCRPAAGSGAEWPVVCSVSRNEAP